MHTMIPMIVCLLLIWVPILWGLLAGRKHPQPPKNAYLVEYDRGYRILFTIGAGFITALILIFAQSILETPFLLIPFGSLALLGAFGVVYTAAVYVEVLGNNTLRVHGLLGRKRTVPIDTVTRVKTNYSNYDIYAGGKRVFRVESMKNGNRLRKLLEERRLFDVQNLAWPFWVQPPRLVVVIGALLSVLGLFGTIYIPLSSEGLDADTLIYLIASLLLLFGFGALTIYQVRWSIKVLPEQLEYRKRFSKVRILSLSGLHKVEYSPIEIVLHFDDNKPLKINKGCSNCYLLEAQLKGSIK